jgi:hypothetical protein
MCLVLYEELGLLHTHEPLECHPTLVTCNFLTCSTRLTLSRSVLLQDFCSVKMYVGRYSSAADHSLSLYMFSLTAPRPSTHSHHHFWLWPLRVIKLPSQAAPADPYNDVKVSCCIWCVLHYLGSRAVFLNILLPTAHPTLTIAREGTPQNFA